MARGQKVFSIVELIRGPGGTLSAGVRFEWTASGQSSPRTNWTWEKTMRTVRTDYEGSDLPTEQVLGRKFEDFTITGKWDDRYNPLPDVADGTGFAQQTLEAMEDLVERANLCQFQLEKNGIVGIIKKLKVIYRRQAEIGYEITVSPHYRDQRGQARKPPAIVSKQADQMIDELDGELKDVQAAQDEAPEDAMIGSTASDIGGFVDGIGNAMEEARSVVETRILGPAGQQVDGFARAAQAFGSIQAECFNLRDQIHNLSADTSLSYQTAITVLDFEVWRHGLMATSQVMYLRAAESANEMARRARPNAGQLYRPRKGESLMGISTRFFGTPFHWREIARRNNLQTIQLTGNEILVIPTQLVLSPGQRQSQRTSTGSLGHVGGGGGGF